ncbi:MAG TPA: hypothetical protein VLE69_00595 [Candidatus Saccharimonadales bacterium]|nr:hypothetical protein [Candidatus Saccharimonadales bacterium]
MKLARLHHKSPLREPIWHVQLAVIAAILLQMSINHHLAVGPKYAVAGFEALLLISLAVVRPGVHSNSARLRLRRLLAVLLIALVSIANLGSLLLVLHALLYGGQVSGRDLLTSGVAIYLTNIIIFGLWYWELDNVDDNERDFLFPQMTAPESATHQPNWQPAFFDYLYVSITNGSAFSPTDTMPLTHRIKFLMTAQSLISLATVVLVTARAVNILV